jgi:hypothetical protein
MAKDYQLLPTIVNQARLAHMPDRRLARIWYGSYVTFRDVVDVRLPELEGKPVIATHLIYPADGKALCGTSLAHRQQSSFTTVECQLCWVTAHRIQEGPRKPLLAPRWKPYAYGDRWSYRFV